MAPAMSLLHEMALHTPTAFWNDACDVASLKKAVAHGATGATSNPVIVLDAIRQDEEKYLELTRRLVAENPQASEVQLAWQLVENAATEGAAILQPVFEKNHGRCGRLSVQVDPTFYRNSLLMVEHAQHLYRLAPNMAIKIPAVPAGIAAIEELTARGIVTNATVGFGIPQALAVAEAVERGWRKAETAGVDLDRLTPWCTIMVGRLDDHLRDIAADMGAAIDLEIIRHASTATFRKAYAIFAERRYHTTLLAAAMRSHHHWSDFVGGKVVVTIPPSWQDQFNASGVSVESRIHDPVPPEILRVLHDTFSDFGKAYDEEGMAPEAFLGYGATIKTLRQFIGGYHELVSFVRDIMLPPP